jgi:hypothetical protein
VATTNGTFVISRLSGAAMLTVTMVRKADNSGYRLHISPEMMNYPDKECDAAAFINKVIEKEIMRAPEQYLWCIAALKLALLANPLSISDTLPKVSFATNLFNHLLFPLVSFSSVVAQSEFIAHRNQTVAVPRHS